jgi:hypothetical protein
MEGRELENDEKSASGEEVVGNEKIGALTQWSPLFWGEGMGELGMNWEQYIME